LRVSHCKYNLRDFAFEYFPHHLTLGPSILHEDLFAQLQLAIDNNEPDRIADAAPRGNAKSTIISLILPIWCAVYSKKAYILTISDTSEQAEDFLQNIRSEFEENEKLIDDFGEMEGLIWTNGNLVLSNGVRIQALGAGKRIRGRKHRQYRPDLIICDDLENDENVQSPDQRKKMLSWYFKALSKAGSDGVDIIVIGTIIHYDSLLNNLLKNPIYKTRKYRAVISWSNSPLWDEWQKIITNLEDLNRMDTAKAFFEERRAEMLAGTMVLWPEKEDYYNLMVQLVADGPSAFSSEKQNEPLSDEERRFNEKWIQYFEMEDLVGKELFVVVFIDPSMGKHGGDYSAIVVLGMDANYQIYVLAADIQRRHPDIIISDTIAHGLMFGPKKIGVEENQFQEYFKDNFIKKCNEDGLNFEIVGIRQISDKILRIESLQPDIKNGRVKFRRDQQKLIEQLVNFPSADHDDGPDALEGAITLLGRRSAIADFYKAQADEANRPTPQTFLQNPNLQSFGR
jgi:predicted phage terminase large subunit-like protein